MNRPPVMVDSLLVSIVGGLQPDKLLKSFDGADDGMYARVLFAWADQPAYQPLSDETAEIEPEIINCVGRLENLPAEETEPNGNRVFAPRDICFSAEAMPVFEN